MLESDSRWDGRRLTTTTIVLVLPVAGITFSELAIFFDQVQLALWGHVGTLLLTIGAPSWFEREANLSAVLTLVPLFRLVSLGMPVFVPEPLYWLPLVYGSLLPACYLVAKVVRTTQHETDEIGSDSREAFDAPADVEPASDQRQRGSIPDWIGRIPLLNRLFESSVFKAESDGGRVVKTTDHDGRLHPGASARPATEVRTGRRLAAALLFPGIVVSIVLAEAEYLVIDPQPLVQTLGINEMLVLSALMIGLVGFVEELLFRGLLQRTLQRQMGRWQGLLLASSLFGLSYSVYGMPEAMLLGSAIGLLFGLFYDWTDSLALVSIMHGVLNVFLFAIVPIQGSVLLAFP